MMELRENPKGAAEGVIIESKVEKGRGPVATVLVQKGTLKKGDAIVVVKLWTCSKSLMDDSGKNVKEAGPSIPVQILGLNDVPAPGDMLNVVKNEREAKKVVENRIAERKKLENVEVPKVKLS
jgi:translation initiation factor IF-2